MAVSKGKFTLNDVDLEVPPTQISIQKNAANLEWQTLRTRNSQKVKSGHSTIDVNFSSTFVGLDDINENLRRLVAQVSLTPICYCNNEFVRDAVYPLGETDEALLLIMKGMTLTVQPELKDTVVMNFNSAWMNHQPFISSLSFKEDALVNRPVHSPAESNAWKKFYQAEMGELDGDSIFSSSSKYQKVGSLDSSLSLVWKELKLGSLSEPTPSGFLPATGQQYETSGSQTKTVGLFFKDRKLDFTPESGLVVTGLTVVWENIVSALPVIGHQYMTYQHIGSIDPRVIIRISAVGEEARNNLVAAWESIQRNALHFRFIPAELTDTTMVNDLVNLCGMKKFITESLTDETIPGQPGTFAFTLVLKGNEYPKREGLVQEFITTKAIRQSIAKVLNKFITFTKPETFFTGEDRRFGLSGESFSTVERPVTTRGIASALPQGLGKELLDHLIGQWVEVLNNSEQPLEFSLFLEEGGGNLTAEQVNKFALESGAINFLDRLTVDGTLDLPEFSEAKLASAKSGAFRGSSAYPDMDSLARVAEGEKLGNNLAFDPDFYFYSPNTSAIAIDPAYVDAAILSTRKLYTDQASTGDDWGNIINSLNRYGEEFYLNRFDDGTDAKLSLVRSANQIKKFRANSSDTVQPPLIQKAIWSNALASPGQHIKISTDGVDILSFVQKDGLQVVSANKVPLLHSGDPAAIYTEQGATFSTEEVSQMGLYLPPVYADITSDYGDLRAHGTSPHTGIDYGVQTGSPVVAAATGVVFNTDPVVYIYPDGRQVKVALENSANHLVGFGSRVWIRHPDGVETVYAHLSDISVKTGDIVQAGDWIGLSGGGDDDYGRGSATGEHLHFGARRDGLYINPHTLLSQKEVARDTGIGEGSEFGTSLLARSLASVQDDLENGQGPSMARAYPTFKLYFIEDDQEDRILGFDDFFGYNAVKSIRVVRSRKVPADLCVIELTNVSGILTNRKFANDFNELGQFIGDKPLSDGTLAKEDINQVKVGTAAENHITSLMLQEGTKILLKLGYSNDPARLEDVFVGQICEVELNETDDLITITCQSYATELVQMVKGQDSGEKKSGILLGFNDAVTTRLLSNLMAEPEMLHFGRWRRSVSRGQPTNSNLSILTNKFSWVENPADDNIFPPVLSENQFRSLFDIQNFDSTDTSLFNGMLDTVGISKSFQVSLLSYLLSKTTIWDVFKEMELRHPGCISSPVPYWDRNVGPRMTMFFGLPNQLYFARDPSLREERASNFVKRTVEENEALFYDQYDIIREQQGLPHTNGNSASEIAKTGDPFDELWDAREEYIRRSQKTLALKNHSIRPFRSYHLLTSNNHIVENNIRASKLDVYNAVAIEYSPNNHIIAQGAIDFIQKHFGFIPVGGGTFRLKVDAGLPEEETHEALLQYPNCLGEGMAQNYALGALKQSLRDIYKGEVVIIGNPSIKPYDICYIFDEYTDMVGPVEVEQVVHYFSQQTGFITEITPDICVSINEWSTQTTMDTVGLALEGAISNFYGRPLARKNPVQSNTARNLVVPAGVTLPLLLSKENAVRLPVALAGADLINASVAIGKSIQQGSLQPLLENSSLFQAGTVVGNPGAISTNSVPFLLAGVFLQTKLVNLTKFRHPISFSPLLLKGRPLIAGVANKVTNQNWWTDLSRWYKDGVNNVGLFFDDLTDKLTLLSGSGDIRDIGNNTVTTDTSQQE